MRCEYYVISATGTAWCIKPMSLYAKRPVLGVDCDGDISKCPIGMPHLRTTAGKARVL